MAIVFYILLGGSVIFLAVMGIAFRNAPPDPYEKLEEERLKEMFHENDIERFVIIDDEEKDEELDEEQDNENEEDQD